MSTPPSENGSGRHRSTPNNELSTWWRQAAVYQVYPRSFADSNGDGIGDLAGVTSRVPYLRELGIDAVWLSPFYPSALADGGYDVDDYRDVDEKLGTLADFDEMSDKLHAAGIKLIADIVPNHSSDRHEWFQQALAAPKGSAERDRYIFRDGKGPDGENPPSDWQSVFGGSAWEPVGDGQWYLHLFAPEQPDWNWDNPDVHADFIKTIRFWADRGVDGFRIDVAHGLAKDMSEPLPTQAMLDAADRNHNGSSRVWDRDEVHRIYAEWREVFDEYDPPRTGIAEAWVHSDRRARYASPEGLGQAFNFDLLEADWSADEFRSIIAKNLAEAAESGASSTWVLSNHDVVRHATRYGLSETDSDPRERAQHWLLDGADAPELDAERGLRRARAATLLIFALPGSAYIYQGEELGLHEVRDLPDEARQDPVFFRKNGAEVGRDGCRVPLPWAENGISFGFGEAEAHLPQPAWFADYSVEAEDGTPGSTLKLYRDALRLRHRLQAAERLDWAGASNDRVVHFVRPGGWHCVTNFGDAAVELPDGDVLLSSAPLDSGRLPAEATAWVHER